MSSRITTTTICRRMAVLVLLMTMLHQQQPHQALAFTFVPTKHTQVHTHHCLSAAKKSSGKKENKGFGATTPVPIPKKQSESIPTTGSSISYNEESNKSLENPNTPQSSSNMGQRALEDLRRERAEQRDAELKKVKEIRSVDEFIRDDPNAAVIPEPVAMRMGSRMLPFVGIPLFGGMGAFVAFWYFATYKNVEFEPAMVAASTIALLVVGLVGITYSVMSASWDADREGSVLGLDEFSKNVDSLKQGLSRSRENALIRERMAGMSESEIQAAIRDLDKREQQRTKKKGMMEIVEDMQPKDPPVE